MSDEKRQWYHFTDWGESEIVYITEDEKDWKECYFGPFKTFTECKKDALDYHRSDVKNSQKAIWRLKKVKRKDFE